MVFNSIEFLLFLPVVFMLYWGLFRSVKARNILIIAASYVFYGWWNYRFLLLIAFTTVCSFVSGLLLELLRGKRKVSLIVLWGNVALNLGILGLFKYFNFFTSSLAALMAPLGIELDVITLDLVLPVGISFYTFQALSYSIDVYRGRVAATHDAVAFFAFISFFPQLVAGPIERATNLLPQFLERHDFSYPVAVDGMRRILWGLFKKVVIADNCAEVANVVFDNYTEAGSVALWYGALCFTFQIYCDFSGYSDMAIGTARLFGFNLMRNFRLPYFARDIAEFWRKWHISLTTWFRDYIYIPLGGSRVGKAKVVRNTFIIFLTSGLWHGADWTFVVWGGYHALLFLPLILTGKNRRYVSDPGGLHGLPAMRESVLMAFTFLVVLIGWVIFRADNISMALGYLRLMFTDFTGWHILGGRMALMWIVALLGVEWFTRKKEYPLEFSGRRILGFRTARWILYYTLFMAVLFLGGTRQTFIYFQF